jgi:hypothetical protein
MEKQRREAANGLKYNSTLYARTALVEIKDMLSGPCSVLRIVYGENGA